MRHAKGLLRVTQMASLLSVTFPLQFSCSDNYQSFPIFPELKILGVPHLLLQTFPHLDHTDSIFCAPNKWLNSPDNHEKFSHQEQCDQKVEKIRKIFGKSCQKSCRAKRMPKCLHQSSVWNLKTSTSNHFWNLKDTCNKLGFATADLGKNVKKCLGKRSPYFSILGYFMLSINCYGPSKVTQLIKNHPIWSPWPGEKYIIKTIVLPIGYNGKESTVNRSLDGSTYPS